MNRRDFVQLMGLASGATLLSCDLDRQSEKLIPYLVPPDDGVIPGKGIYKHTTCAECPAGCGMAARVVDYRAAKLEGIAGHPINDGALCVRGQASISRLYHPDRVTAPLSRQGGGFAEVSWDSAFASILDGLRTPSGRHVYLSGRTTGTLSRLTDEFCREAGVERLPEFEVFSHAAIREANGLLFGRREVPSYRVDQADFLLTIGADLFETFTSPVSHAVQFGRATKNGRFDWMHVEPHVSLTGVQAKRRHAIAPGTEPYLLAYLLRQVSLANLGGEHHIAGIVDSLPDLPSRGFADKTGLSVEVLETAARDLLSARRPLVVAGGPSTMQKNGLDVAILTGLLQWARGMMGSTVDFSTAQDYDRVGDLRDVAKLSQRLARGEIGVLFLSDVDPVGRLGGGADLETNLSKAKLRVGIGQFMTPTLAQCDIVLPLSDTLESWGDAGPRRGLLAVVQPAVEPLHDTRTAGDILIGILAGLKGGTAATPYQQYLFARWRESYGEDEIERLLREGYLDTGAAAGGVELKREDASNRIRRMVFQDSLAKPVLVVTPSVRSFDGRGRAIDLLSEVPDPLTTISYGGWVSVPKVSEAGPLEDRDEVRLSIEGWSAEVPAKVQPGMPRGIMSVQRGAVERVPFAFEEGSGELVTVFAGAVVSRTGRKVAIPILSGSLSQEGRGVIPDGGGKDEHHGEHGGTQATLYPAKVHPDYRWAMAIDLDLCIGCSACASACYVENNVPVVGPKDHLKGREMSWIRIEPFYNDKTEEPEFQPMLCQQCTNAPCEAVCPVYATYHNPEGLNAQVYNRCVGTRYCANNCPYKVRRFNWWDHKRPSERNSTRNPEVSIRGRGIMEKCTFCVQRIRAARDTAKDESRKIRDGEVVPACAQTCPTKAITFGNLLDEQSEVYKWAHSDRAYRVLDLLGTDPGVHYLRSNGKNGHA